MTLTVPSAAVAGVMFSISFAIFTASMAEFKEERVASRRFGRWDFASMVKIRGSECKKKPNPNTMSGYLTVTRLVQTEPSEGEMAGRVACWMIIESWGLICEL